MTCPNDGNAIQDRIAELGDALGWAAPGLGKLVGKGIAARARGQKADVSLGDYAEGVQLDTALAMGIGQALNNAGKAAMGGVAGAAPEIKDAVENIDTSIDQNPDGGPGTCNPDPDDPPPSSPKENVIPPESHGPGGPGGGPSGAANPNRVNGPGGGGGDPELSDPLVIDLDGDGIELVALSGSSVHFDFGGDSFAERTGWVSADDALLVYDRNGNGRIDNGSELFGREGVDGFDALAELDGNRDGKFNLLDGAFNALAVWRDVDQDGVTDPGELRSLTSVAITEISLTAQSSGQSMAGNWVARSSAVTFAAGEAKTAASVYFTTNPTTTRYIPPDGFEYHELVQALPDLKGFGQVTDLSVAISLDASLRDQLRALIIDSHSMTFDQFRLSVRNLVDAWVQVGQAPQSGRGAVIDYDKLAVVEAFQGVPFWQQQIDTFHANLVHTRYDSIIDGLVGRLLPQISYSHFALGLAEGGDVGLLEHSLSAFAVFHYDRETDSVEGRPDLFLALATGSQTGTAAEQLVKFERVIDFVPSLSKVLFHGDDGALSNHLAALASDATVFGSFSLADTIAAIRHNIVNGTAGNDSFQPDHAAIAAGQGTVALGFAGDDAMWTGWRNDILMGGEGNDHLDGQDGNDALIGGTGNDALWGMHGDDTYVFNRGDGQDMIREYHGHGSAGGFDTIAFGAGIAPADVRVHQENWGNHLILTIAGTDDRIHIDWGIQNYHQRIDRVIFANGTVWTFADLMARATAPTDGNDIIYGAYEDDVLSGGAGNDHINGEGGNDTLIGGPGTDWLYGMWGDDTYVFNRGDGQNWIREYHNHGSAGGFDTLAFGPGISPSDLIVRQGHWGNHIDIFIAGTNDHVIIEWGIQNYHQRVDRVTFTDGTVWSFAELMARSAAPTEGNDYIFGAYENDVLNGGGGNDHLGGEGGDDTLIGGPGNDALHGLWGNDTYVFNRGDGQDVIREFHNHGGADGHDVLQFGPGIAPSDVIVSQIAGAHIIFQLAGTSDRVTVEWSLHWGNQRVDEVRFATGEVWSHADVLALSLRGTDADEHLEGNWSNDLLTGSGGNDTLLGHEGHDTLHGGAGNDMLRGGADNDVYRFGRGDGADHVVDYIGGWNFGGWDVLELGPGITPDDLLLRQVYGGADILIAIRGTSDQIILGATTWDGNCRIEQIRFADGLVWSHMDLMAALTRQNEGDDAFHGGWEDDTLLGGAGIDYLYGNHGNDILHGGIGNDELHGGAGNDEYRFERGDGADHIVDWIGHGNTGGWDVLRLGPGIAPVDLKVSIVAGGRDILIELTGTGDQLLLHAAVSDGNCIMEQVFFHDGTVWSHADLLNAAKSPTAGSSSADNPLAAEDDESLFSNVAAIFEPGHDANGLRPILPEII